MNRHMRLSLVQAHTSVVFLPSSHTVNKYPVSYVYADGLRLSKHRKKQCGGCWPLMATGAQ